MNMRTTKVVTDILQAGRTGDHERFLDLMAPDAVIEWPYRLEGMPAKLCGRAEIAAFVSAQGSLISFDEYVDLVMHETVDPEVIIVEYTVNGTVTGTGAPFTQRIIAVLRVRDGQVVSYRDYINPLPLMKVLESHDA
ncbi:MULTISPECIES: nuclear transport factor 2 family protein [unclassified Nonomuraea]|uniref:nuclear transport factor 2 family protein n=1 Tax=unclassified Nonomuraea TaxID=2593643 RepID=UPI003411646B